MGNNYAKLKSRQDLPTLFKKTLNRIEALESKEIYAEKFDSTIEIYEPYNFSCTEDVNAGIMGDAILYNSVTTHADLQKSKGKIYTDGINNIFGINTIFTDISDSSTLIIFHSSGVFSITDFVVMSNTLIQCTLVGTLPNIIINDPIELFHITDSVGDIYGYRLFSTELPLYLSVGSQIFQPYTYTGVTHERFASTFYDKDNRIKNSIIGISGEFSNPTAIFGKQTSTPTQLYGTSSIIKMIEYSTDFYIILNRPLKPSLDIFYQNTLLNEEEA